MIMPGETKFPPLNIGVTKTFANEPNKGPQPPYKNPRNSEYFHLPVTIPGSSHQDHSHQPAQHGRTQQQRHILTPRQRKPSTTHKALEHTPPPPILTTRRMQASLPHDGLATTQGAGVSQRRVSSPPSPLVLDLLNLAVDNVAPHPSVKRPNNQQKTNKEQPLEKTKSYNENADITPDNRFEKSLTKLQLLVNTKKIDIYNNLLALAGEAVKAAKNSSTQNDKLTFSLGVTISTRGSTMTIIKDAIHFAMESLNSSERKILAAAEAAHCSASYARTILSELSALNSSISTGPLFDEDLHNVISDTISKIALYAARVALETATNAKNATHSK